MANFATRLVGVLGAALLLSPAFAQVTIDGASTQVTSGVADEYDPSIDGDLVVYTQANNGARDVAFTDLSNNSVGTVPESSSTFETSQELQDVSNGVIVYTEVSTATGNPVIRTFDVAASTASSLQSASANDAYPTISGDVIVFEAFGTSRDIYAYDRSVGTAPIAIATTADHERFPRVDGRSVVFQRSSGSTWSVVLYDFDTNSETVLDSGLAVHPTPDISGSTVAWVTGASGDTDITVLDLVSGDLKSVAAAGIQNRPRLAGEMLAYDDYSTGDIDVVLRHLTSGAESRISGITGSTEYLNDITANRVAYASNQDGNFDVWVYEFTVSEPPATDYCASTDAPDESHTFTESASATVGGPVAGALVVQASGDCSGASVSVDGQVVLSEADFAGGEACWSFDLDGSAVVDVTIGAGAAGDDDDGDDDDHRCGDDDGDDDDHDDDGDDDDDGDHDDDGDDDDDDDDDDHGHRKSRKGGDHGHRHHGHTHGHGHHSHGHGHGHGHDHHDHGQTPASDCTLDLAVHLADGVSATATPPVATVTPPTPSTGCESGTGTTGAWLILLVAGGLLLSSRRQQVPVSLRRRPRR